MEPILQFSKTDRPEFFDTLRKRVNNYFKENEISRYANLNMKIKTFSMLTIYFLPFILMLVSNISSFSGSLVLWSIMGIGMSGIGLSIMHDANHGAYSQSKKVNDFFGFVLNFIGGYHINWRIQHNVLHHSFTNIEGYDEDIEKKGIIRFSPNQKRKKFFRFQLYYAPFLYSILTFYWVTFKDYEQLVSYNKRGLLKGQGLTFGTALRKIILYKVAYFGVTIGLPILLTGLLWWQVVIGFVLMQLICGLILALVFQSAHVLEETHFFEPNGKGSMENSWAIHQLATTSNFSRGNVPLTWFIGGLNYQIEHHLFPGICHVHYPEVAKIVRQTAEEYNIEYLEHKTFYKALKSHFTLLNDLGTGAYDRRSEV